LNDTIQWFTSDRALSETGFCDLGIRIISDIQDNPSRDSKTAFPKYESSKQMTVEEKTQF
jgi:hypothetical protein